MTTNISDSSSTEGSASVPWTCPFCSLLCDGYRLGIAPALRLVGSDCPRAQAALAYFDPSDPDDPFDAGAPLVDGVPATLDAALDAAAAILRDARLPLFGGLSTDVDGMRALYRLANRSGAILDHAQGEAQMYGLRALQDRGLIFTTLAEIRNRADLIVCLGTDAVGNFPEFFRRCAPVEGQAAARSVFVGVPAQQGLLPTEAGEHIAAPDLFDAVAQLAALVAERRVPAADEALRELAGAMRAAHYCVVVWEPGRLSAQGALIAEAVLRIVTTLNRSTRAGGFALGGSEGAQTANAVMTWLSGVPLRSRVGPAGLEHDPLRFATERLLARHEVDTLLWVGSLVPTLTPPDVDLPCVVLGHPGLVGSAARVGTVFIPVATPGINAAGHLVRADSVVTLPLDKMREDGLPTVAQIAHALADRLELGQTGEGRQ